jgi:type IV pilus assembly protein PilO
MNEAVQRFLERPKSHKIAFVVLSFAFITFVFWQYIYSGISEEYTTLSEKVDELNSRITEEKRKARNLDKLRKRVKELDAQLARALTELPDRRDVAALLNSISNLAKESGLEVKLFKPSGSENTKQFFAEVPVSISVEGRYHQVAGFFDEVGRLPRIVNINDISLHDSEATPDGVKVKTDCTATTFRYLDEAERKRMAEVTEESGKRRRK